MSITETEKEMIGLFFVKQLYEPFTNNSFILGSHLDIKIVVTKQRHKLFFNFFYYPTVEIPSAVGIQFNTKGQHITGKNAI